MNKLIIFLVNFFDHFHKKKIIKFIKNDLRIDNIELFLDIGGHHGETVDLFCKNFIIQNIISIEASPKNYEILLSKKKSFIKKFSNTKIELEKLALGNEKRIIKMKEFTKYDVIFPWFRVAEINTKRVLKRKFVEVSKKVLGK